MRDPKSTIDRSATPVIRSVSCSPGAIPKLSNRCPLPCRIRRWSAKQQLHSASGAKVASRRMRRIAKQQVVDTVTIDIKHET